MKPSINVFWFRRDLRLNDNAGLYHALKEQMPVVMLFIFDRNILDGLENKKDARVSFIYGALVSLQKQLEKYNTSIEIFYDKPVPVFTS
jgi:deoxyribodipyrimidine photo-lyase